MSDLPKGWIRTELDEHASINGRIGWKGLKRSEYTDNGPLFLAVKNILQNGEIDFANTDHISRERYDESPEIKLQIGDILLTKDGTIGKVGMVQFLPAETTVNSSILVIRPKNSLLRSRYLFHFLRGPQFQTIAYERITGSAVPHLFQKDLKKLSALVPPLSEQGRIVAKLEKLLSKVDACRTRLETIPVILKRFRQTVLAAACSGSLTTDWREKSSGNESITAVIESIYRRRKSEANTKSQKDHLCKLIAVIEKNDSSELPEGWWFVSLNKLCSTFDYGTSAKSQPSGKVPVLRMGNIQEGRIDWTDLVYSSDDKEIQKFTLKPGTVLFNRTNSPELVGKTAIYRGEQPAIFAGYLIRINPFPELNPDYLNLCLNTNYAKQFCLTVKTDGVSQSNINAQKLGTFEIPYCPISEQNEIVRRVEELFALAGRIEGRYKKAKSYVDKLTQSILAKAFRGELVPRDPNDQPTEELLKQIRAEKEKTDRLKEKRVASKSMRKNTGR